MVELEPWVIVTGKPPETSIATWQVAGGQDCSLAIFSSEANAAAYAEEYCPPSANVLQLSERKLIQLFVTCYEQGTRFAALDPDGTNARQMFVLRDVLAAARAALKNSQEQS